MTSLRIVRCALLCGVRDYSAIYTWRSWLGGWLVRVLAQVMFFALLGRLLDSTQQTYFLLIGNAIMLAAMEGVWALNMVIWERGYGTLPLLAASPTTPALVLATRGMYLIADGTVSSVSALLVLGHLFGLSLPWPRVLLVIPLTVLVAASAYGFGAFLGALLIGYRWLNGLVANVGLVGLMVLSGVNVPLTEYPAPVRWISQFLPLTHGLIAIRAVIEGHGPQITSQILAEAAVGIGWLSACFLACLVFIWRGRRNGSLHYAV